MSLRSVSCTEMQGNGDGEQQAKKNLPRLVIIMCTAMQCKQDEERKEQTKQNKRKRLQSLLKNKHGDSPRQSKKYYLTYSRIQFYPRSENIVKTTPFQRK